MDKNKKEKQQRQLKLSLKTAVDLTPSMLTSEDQLGTHFIAKVCPQIGSLHSLRILTVIEVIYLVELYLQLIQKYHPLYLPEFKIGVIGGGVMARLILNSLLPLSKDGLSLNNIIVSTRQAQNFKLYTDHFGIQVHFDNQATAAEADFLIIAAPATLDNWIIADIKQILEEKVHQTGNKKDLYFNIPTINKIQPEKPQLNSQNQQNKKQMQQKGNKAQEKTKNRPFRPLVYILTSDFSQEKCQRFFSFPVLTPAVRAKDISSIQQTLGMFVSESDDEYEGHQKILAWWLFQNQSQPKPLESVDSQSLKESLAQSKLGAFVQKYSKSRFQKVIATLAFVLGSSAQTISATSSISNTISLSQSARQRSKDQPLVQILQIASSQGDVEQTYFKKLRKWRMAYNNFIA